jgi:protein-tyrosine phosphatase
VSRPVTRRLGGAIALVLAAAGMLVIRWNARNEKHLRVVVPGHLIRGAWQDPESLRAIIGREHIKTIVTLTAINRDDPKYVGQAKIVSEMGVRWLFVPMRGSTATIEQMAQAADLLADPRSQPVFFHCVAGHHRSSLAHAAYLIRHCGWSAAAAWKEVAGLPWARPTAIADQNDRALIEEFAGMQQSMRPGGPATHDRGAR